jgi:hypothetical protein
LNHLAQGGIKPQPQPMYIPIHDLMALLGMASEPAGALDQGAIVGNQGGEILSEVAA